MNFARPLRLLASFALAALPVAVSADPYVIAGGKAAEVSVSVTDTASSAYAAGNEVGPILTFPGAFLSALSGSVQSLRLVCSSVQTAGFKLELFNQYPASTAFTDKTTPSINGNDIFSQEGAIVLAAPDSSMGTTTTYRYDGLGALLTAPQTSLYGVLVTTGTPTFTTTHDCTITLAISQN